jgi:hypothetical protein
MQRKPLPRAIERQPAPTSHLATAAAQEIACRVGVCSELARSDILNSAIGREDHLPKEGIVCFLELLRNGAKCIDGWAKYTALAAPARIARTKLGRSGGLSIDIALPGFTY